MLSLALAHSEWDEEPQSAGQSFPDVLQGLCVRSCRRQLSLVGNHPSVLICTPPCADGSHGKETRTAWHLSWPKLRSPGCWQLPAATCCYLVLSLTGNAGGVQRDGKCGVSPEAETPHRTRCTLQDGFSLWIQVVSWGICLHFPLSGQSCSEPCTERAHEGRAMQVSHNCL